MKRTITRIAFISTVLLTYSVTFAQDWKRTQNWYFGDSAGFSFATDPPTALTDGKMYALEGCATISDTAGNLLFYTNGMTVWNKNHEVMANGTGLLSNETYAQAALIVPQPSNDSIFFIFTTGHIYYSVVNMNRASGGGEVIEKNVFLLASGTEKLVATHHANGHDVWVATHGGNNNHLISFLVTDAGVIPCPIISKVGSIMTGGANQTQMQFSYSGKLACVSFYSDKFCELLEFDNRSGKFSNPIKIKTQGAYPVGICFAPNEEHLYIAERWTAFLQYDIRSLNEQNIANSRRVFYTHPSIGNDFRAFGDKIYFGLPEKNYMGYFIPSQYSDSIPDLYDSSINISPGKTTYGSPNFISSYFYQPSLDITYHSNCQTDSVVFKPKIIGSLVSPFWQLLRQGNLLYTANSENLIYSFPDTGTYLVRLIDQGDTVSKEVFIEPHLELGNDTVLCNQSELTLSIPENIRCLLWQDGFDTNTYKITQNGIYYVSGYNSRGCLVSDTIQVKFGAVPQATIIRSGDSLYTDTGSYAYQWYRNNLTTGTNASFIRVNQTGNYRVEIMDSVGCNAASPIYSVTILSSEKINPQDILVFPNPLNEGQNLNIEYNKGIHSIEIYDARGKRVYLSGDLLNTSFISIPGLSKGIYFIQINQTYTTTISTN